MSRATRAVRWGLTVKPWLLSPEGALPPMLL
jgi:hypothetical protein